MRILCFLGVCSVLSPGLQGERKGLSMVKEWKQLDYSYPNEAARQQAIASQEFVPGNGLPIDVDVHYGSNSLTKIFVTVPRFVSGIPGTLNTISNEENNGNPLLTPYPSWEWNKNTSSCQVRLVSVFRVQIDECGRLWVLDTGKIGPDQHCPPKIIAFDPSTDLVLHRYEFPKDQIDEKTLLVTPVVDVRDPKNGCRDTFIYSADVTGFGLLVYDVRRQRSWRIENKLFFPIPEWGTFTIAGESFDLMDGILGMALSPYRPGSDRVLFFHSLASNTENYVFTSVIRNETIFDHHIDAAPREFVVYHNKRPSQAAAEAIDRNGIMYFGLASEIAMMCWNTRSDFGQRNFDVVDGNKATMQFASGVKIVNNRKGEQELWTMTNRIQKVYTGSITDKDINFRIQAASTEELTRNTKCRNHLLSGSPSGGGYGFATRPQSSWGGVFSDGKVPVYGQTGNRAGYGVSANAKREVNNEDQLIFTN